MTPTPQEKTVEAIYFEESNKSLPDGIYPGMANDKVYNAMRVFADQEKRKEAIAFAEWLAVNGWYFNKIKRWSNRNESSDNLIEVLSATKATEELYDLYQQSLKQK